MEKRICGLLVVAVFVVAGCYGNKCTTQRLYEGTPISSGTITYGTPPVSETFDCAGPDDSTKKCMQTPDACASLSFGSQPNWAENCAEFTLGVTVVGLQNGQVVTLPSPSVTVMFALNDSHLPYDAGSAKETLTLVSGTVGVTISPNNFDADFNLTFTRPNGGSVVIQNGRTALLDAKWENDTFCN
jgi:hypothetical protein